MFFYYSNINLKISFFSIKFVTYQIQKSLSLFYRKFLKLFSKFQFFPPQIFARKTKKFDFLKKKISGTNLKPFPAKFRNCLVFFVFLEKF